MAKKIQTTIKLQLPAGKATPAPPVGTALGPHGLNIMDFCKQFNARRQGAGRDDFPGARDGLHGPHLHLHPEDAAGVGAAEARGQHREGFPEPNRNKVGKVTKKQVEEIAKIKLVDLNTTNLESAVRTVMGTARNMAWKSWKPRSSGATRSKR